MRITHQGCQFRGIHWQLLASASSMGKENDQGGVTVQFVPQLVLVLLQPGLVALEHARAPLPGFAP